jgi:hypothetical protein
MAAARNLTVFYPDAKVNAVIRAAAEGPRPADVRLREDQRGITYGE